MPKIDLLKDYPKQTPRKEMFENVDYANAGPIPKFVPTSAHVSQHFATFNPVSPNNAPSASLRINKSPVDKRTILLKDWNGGKKEPQPEYVSVPLNKSMERDRPPRVYSPRTRVSPSASYSKGESRLNPKSENALGYDMDWSKEIMPSLIPGSRALPNFRDITPIRRVEDTEMRTEDFGSSVILTELDRDRSDSYLSYRPVNVDRPLYTRPQQVTKAIMPQSFLDYENSFPDGSNTSSMRIIGEPQGNDGNLNSNMVKDVLRSLAELKIMLKDKNGTMRDSQVIDRRGQDHNRQGSQVSFRGPEDSHF